nr:uroporphyrinogen-III C-methyltransferase [Auraticoccus cholistanensis]
MVALELAGRAVLVAGGGPAAARAAASLLDQDADVRVLAEELCEDLAELARTGRVRWTPRPAVAADLDDCWLVVAATGGSLTDRALLAAAAERRRPALAAAGDEPGGGGAREDEAGWGLGSARLLPLEEPSTPSPARSRTGPAGRVVLVGGGPGAEDLITVRGQRWLARADVVVADRLGPTGLLDRLPARVEVVDVGKTPGRHQVSQDEINQVLLDRARAGLTVVRLKGGDPFLFGRGGEEWLACVRAGVAVEVVPGVSSALSVPALAGVPVTHRGTSTGVLVEHGHTELTGAAVRAVVTGEATLVVLMGVANLSRHVATLLAAGADPRTPAALVSDGSTPRQRSVTAPLGRLVAEVESAGLGAPAVVVVGAVVDALAPAAPAGDGSGPGENGA